MTKYNIWWHQEGGMQLALIEAKNSNEARKIINRCLVIRKLKSTKEENDEPTINKMI